MTETPTTHNPDLTLEQAWNQLIVPMLDEITERTRDEYDDAVAIWKRLSGNPPVGVISREIVQDFRQKLIETPYSRGKTKTKKKRTASTVNRIMRDLHVIMSPLWPADRVNPSGLGLTPFFKWPRSLARQKSLPFVYTPENLDALYLNADAARQRPGSRSTGMNDPRLWRAALVLALNCGARTWDLFDLEWSDVREEIDPAFQNGSILFGARKTNKLHRIPLNLCAARHLADLKRRPVDALSSKVFPGFTKHAAFYKTWARICSAACVVGTFESMRKTCVTRHNSVIWNAGFWLSGHIQPGVFGNYDNPNDRIFEAVYKLEQPAAFVRGMEALGAV